MGKLMLVTVRKKKLTDEEEFNLYHNPTAFILTGAVGGSWTLDPTKDGKKSAIDTAIDFRFIKKLIASLL
jgi:hypothetical protein